jgi:hypothetical protein
VRVDVSFPGADGTVLRGWCYRPAGPPPWPGVVMAHGFSAVKEMHLDGFARVLADAGSAVLVHDHRNLGASDSPCPGDLDPEQQVADYSAAIDWLLGHPGIDPSRIGVWGSSYSGGHVLAVAARDPRVRSVVAQVPFLRPLDPVVPQAVEEGLALDRLRRAEGLAPLTVPVVGPPGTACVMPTPDALAYFTGAAAPRWRNEVTLASVGRLLRWRPGDEADGITAPTLLIGARGDDLTPHSTVLEVAASLRARHRVATLGGGHFDPYVARFAEASALARSWFSETLVSP